MEAELVKLTLPDGKSLDINKALTARSTFLHNYIQEFNTAEVSIKPPATKPFNMKSLETVRKYLEKYDKAGPALPKKPFLSTTNWEDYVEKNPELSEILDKIENFYEVVELFNCANYLKIHDLLQLIGAKIAYHVLYQRQSGEDHLREFSQVNKYQSFFTADEEVQFRDKEFSNPSDFEGVIDYYEQLEALP